MHSSISQHPRVRVTGLAALTAALFTFGPARPVQAQIIHADDVVINGSGANDQLCIGDDCANTEVFSENKVKLRIKDNDVALEFVDISPNADDWIIETNQGGIENIRIGNQTNGTTPFEIQALAPSGSLYIGFDGNVGLGTSDPDRDLHIMGELETAYIRLEENSGTTGIWDIGANSDVFYLRNVLSGLIPLLIYDGAPTGSLTVASTGNVGIGTNTPNAPLELRSSDSFNFFRITAQGASVNDSVDITFTGGPLGTGQLRYNIIDGDNQEMSLDANGNVMIDGTLTTAGPTCSGGCDRVFDADYARPSIAKHAAEMFEAGYLPGVGPTLPGQPMNLNEKVGNMLNALEHAHIFIAEQQKLIEQQEADNARQQQVIEQMLVRLAALESQ